MNEGTIAILFQWSLLCLVWMGSFDSQLREWRMSRRRMLAVIAAFLVCSFVSWKFYFAPIQVSLSGTILPLLGSVALYTRLGKERRRIHLVGAMATAVLLVWLRWIFFKDPILLFWEERVIIPAVGVVATLIMSRQSRAQLFQLLFALTLADILHSLYFWKLSGSCMFGTDYAQDLLWSGISFMCVIRLIWSMIRRVLGWREPESSHSDAGR
ncbi:YphA family membrane protein [Brevibacillus sp. NRS-1366]|uniref:YphA family membrane protein n=1 Tax=Brevibacillus sp. NRS-1366 TaxID=3233899 RepID=UPI003D220087